MCRNLCLFSLAVGIYISYCYFFVVKKVTKKPFVRINLLVRASIPPFYAALLLAAARFTARWLADAPSRRQNSYGLVWLRHIAYGVGLRYLWTLRAAGRLVGCNFSDR